MYFIINNWRVAIKPGTFLGHEKIQLLTETLRTNFETSFFQRALLGVVFYAFETRCDLDLSFHLNGLSDLKADH